VNQVNQAPTITTNPTSQTVTAGQTATFTAAASGNPTPTVQWQVSTDGGASFSDLSGATNTTLSFTTIASQNGDEYRAVFTNALGTATTTPPAILTVDYAPVVTTGPSNVTVNAGQTATFTAAASDGNPTPTTVQWQVNTGSGFTNLSNTGVYSGVTTDALIITGVTAGLNGAQYQAVFSNTAGLTATTSAATLTVKAVANTTTMLALSPKSSNPSVFGQAVTFTATVSAVAPATGTPTGSVTLLDGSITLGTATLSTGGKATFTTRALPVGSHTITLSYGGDSNFITSTSTALTQAVNQDATTTTVAASANPSVSGQPITFTATVKAVAPGSGVPTGTVTFFDGSTSLGPAQLLDGSGHATISISTLAVGSHTITASYVGDSNFTVSVSPALTQTVNQAATKTTVTSSANPSGSGKPVTFTATVKAVAPGIGTPTGTVTFSINGTLQSPVSLTVINGVDQATFTTAPLFAGTYTITAVYDGDSNFTTSTSAAFSQRVK
jgi:predicted secreted protein